MVGNVGLWPAKTFEWRRAIQDFKSGGPLEVLTIAKLVKITVLLHQFWNLIINWHYRIFSIKHLWRLFKTWPQGPGVYLKLAFNRGPAFINEVKFSSFLGWCIISRGVARICQRGAHHPGIADYTWFIQLLSLVYQWAQSYYRGMKAHIN